MNIKKYFFVIFSSLFLISLSSNSSLTAQNKKFSLVVDAGHGGHDPGAMGSIIREKDINLAVALKFGELVDKNFNDVRVIYTRKTDVYLTLQQRADIVNNNHADLFISFHTNAAKSSSAYGTETYTLGLTKSKTNLDVAMRENSVILLEDDYKTKYKGFDPASVESYIMFEFMQDKYLDKSIDFAQTIQKQFTNHASRSDRGVRQAGFWVLHRSACPSVLIELGFISNPAEQKYLASSDGQQNLANSVYNAFVNFKRNHDNKSGIQTSSKNYVEISKTEEKPSRTEELSVENRDSANKVSSNASDSSKSENRNTEVQANDNKVVFKIQLMASTLNLKSTDKRLKGLKNVENFRENGLYKYTYGAENEYEKISDLRKEIISKFPEAFIIAFVSNKKITAKEGLELVK